MTAALILARRVQPAAFAITLSCVAIALSWWNFERIDGPWEQVVSVSMMTVAAWLTVGWIVNSNRMMRWGLLAASFVWVYVAVIAIEVLGATPANWLSALAWASLAGGSYWLEQAEHAGRAGES